MDVAWFESAERFREWLARHHDSARELWVGFHRKGTGRSGLTYAEAVEEAICFGWIDGVRRRVDAERYANRFTPRRPDSHWSRVNVERAERLIRAGRMAAPGLRAYRARDPEGDNPYERRHEAVLSEDAEARFRGNGPAWRYFEEQPPGYRQNAIWWVISAKRPGTRERRLDTLIEDSAARRRIAPLRRPDR